MKAKTVKEKDHAREQAQAQLRSVTEMVEVLKEAQDSEDPDAETMREEAERRIQEDALSVNVRSDWYQSGAESPLGEYSILLCTGGPACRIIGELSEYNEPETARIEYQDWFTPWTEYRLTSEEEQTVLAYARCFYYGE